MTHAHVHGGGGAAPAAKATPTWRLLLTLALAGAAAGLLVVSVYAITLPAVRKHAGERIEGAVREVLRAPARWDTLYLAGNALSTTPPAGVDARDAVKAYVSRDSAGARTGAAIVASGPGFQETMELMVGFDPATGTIIGIKVLDEKETPGLGDKIENDPSFLRQFAAHVAPVVGVKTKPTDATSQVQTITGATISSRAVIRIVNRAVADWRPRFDAYDKGTVK